MADNPFSNQTTRQPGQHNRSSEEMLFNDRSQTPNDYAFLNMDEDAIRSSSESQSSIKPLIPERNRSVRLANMTKNTATSPSESQSSTRPLIPKRNRSIPLDRKFHLMIQSLFIQLTSHHHKQKHRPQPKAWQNISLKPLPSSMMSHRSVVSPSASAYQEYCHPQKSQEIIRR
jgi:hypothetical protein